MGLSMHHILTIFYLGIKKAGNFVLRSHYRLLGVARWKSIQHVESVYKIIYSLSHKLLRGLHNEERSQEEVLLKNSQHHRVYECGAISDAALLNIAISLHLLTLEHSPSQDQRVKNIFEGCFKNSKGIDQTRISSQRFGLWNSKSAEPFTITSSQHNTTRKPGFPKSGMKSLGPKISAICVPERI